MLNIAPGLNLKPELMLELDKKHTDKDIADRKAKLWNGKDLDWYVEHGHSVTPRQPKKTYRPWEGLRLRFYIEDLVRMRDDLKRKMEEANVPIRHEWDWECYQPLPLPLIDPVHKEPAEFDLYAITFKEIQLNFAETLGNPWIDDVVYRDPVHTTFLMNARTGAKHGISDGDIVELISPYGRIFGRVALSQGVQHETIASVELADAHRRAKPQREAWRRQLQRAVAFRPAQYRRLQLAARIGRPRDDTQIVDAAGEIFRPIPFSLRGGCTDAALGNGLRPQALHRLQRLRDRLQAREQSSD